ncbi:hypothetical protein TruAng_001405 [Truncatella angustata]|nr:hypothetical protein TruAng_001405 [Truncatella angustata]
MYRCGNRMRSSADAVSSHEHCGGHQSLYDQPIEYERHVAADTGLDLHINNGRVYAVPERRRDRTHYQTRTAYYEEPVCDNRPYKQSLLHSDQEQAPLNGQVYDSRDQRRSKIVPPSRDHIMARDLRPSDPYGYHERTEKVMSPVHGKRDQRAGVIAGREVCGDTRPFMEDNVYSLMAAKDLQELGHHEQYPAEPRVLVQQYFVFEKCTADPQQHPEEIAYIPARVTEGRLTSQPSSIRTTPRTIVHPKEWVAEPQVTLRRHVSPEKYTAEPQQYPVKVPYMLIRVAEGQTSSYSSSVKTMLGVNGQLEYEFLTVDSPKSMSATSLRLLTPKSDRLWPEPTTVNVYFNSGNQYSGCQVALPSRKLVPASDSSDDLEIERRNYNSMRESSGRERDLDKLNRRKKGSSRKEQPPESPRDKTSNRKTLRYPRNDGCRQH